MSLLANQSFVNPEISLWNPKSLPASFYRPVTIVSPVTIAPSNVGTIATIVFASPVNFVKLKGWIDIQTSTTVTGCSLFLGAATDVANVNNGTSFNTITITGTGVSNRFLLDNLYYYEGAPFSSLSLRLGRNSSGVSQSFTSGASSGSVAYASLPTVTWGTGSGEILTAIAGVAN